MMVDICIADEVMGLNNNMGISTQYSCCSGGYKATAFIKVLEKDIPKMIELGYVQRAPKSNPQFFKVKSKLMCNHNGRIKFGCEYHAL